MGEVIHRATIVTSWNGKMVGSAYAAAADLFSRDLLSGVFLSPVNHYHTFIILPCGSKTGWTEKADDDASRAEFMQWVSRQCYDDGGNALEVADVQYGSDMTHTPHPTPADGGTGAK